MNDNLTPLLDLNATSLIPRSPPPPRHTSSDDRDPRSSSIPPPSLPIWMGNTGSLATTGSLSTEPYSSTPSSGSCSPSSPQQQQGPVRSSIGITNWASTLSSLCFVCLKQSTPTASPSMTGLELYLPPHQSDLPVPLSLLCAL